MLVEFENRIINTDHIVSAEPGQARGTRETWRLTLSTGEAIATDDPLPSLSSMCGVIIPAQPGFAAVEAFLPDATEPNGSVFYRTSTVLAFRIVPGPFAPTPITVEGEQTSSGHVLVAVIDPTGHCVAESAGYGSLAEFQEYCEARAASRRAAGGNISTASPLLRPSEASPPVAPEGDGKANPLLALRALIAAEPIQSVSSSPVWRQGLTPADTIEAVRHAYPDLHTNGVGYSPEWGWKWGAGDREKARADMTADGNVEAFEAALRFLSHAGRQFAQPRVNRKRTSYSWKHAAERVMGDYVPNGMLIAAAYALGFEVETTKDSPNVCINLSEKAVALDPGKGLF